MLRSDVQLTEDVRIVGPRWQIGYHAGGRAPHRRGSVPAANKTESKSDELIVDPAGNHPETFCWRVHLDQTGPRALRVVERVMLHVMACRLVGAIERVFEP